jgi:predicted lipid-binding transport protein (Tim44 family)
MTMQQAERNRWRRRGWGLAAGLLLAPLLAMQITDSVRWDAADFAMLAVMLLVAAIALEIAMRLFDDRRALRAAAAGILLAFVLVWADAAVGVF